MKKLISVIIFAALIFTFSLSAFSVNAYNENTEFKSSYSSKDEGYCTPVKNQVLNTCWIYSSMATFESLLLKNNLFTSDLSTNHLDNWAIQDENNEGWVRKNGDAGYAYTSMGYLTSWNGPVDIKNNNINIGTTAIQYLDKDNETQIKKAIINSGAVVTSYNAIGSCLSSDKCSFAMINEQSYINGHSISVVGWDDNYSKENFNGAQTPLKDGAWLCKNSWGENNSLGGYFWISYEDFYIFNEEVFGPSYSIEGFQQVTENDFLYQNENYGATYHFNHINKNDKVYFNVFDFTSNGNSLDKVVFNTKSKGGDFTLYYAPIDKYGTPVKDKTLWTYLYEGKIDYRGYICCDFEDIILPKDKGSIAVEINTENINKGLSSKDEKYIKNTIGVCEWLQDAKNDDMIFINQGQYGESFIMTDNKIYDVMDLYKKEFNDTIGGTFVIKAITNGIIDTELSGDVNLDKEVDIKDATLIQKYLVSINPYLAQDQIGNADFNNDGYVNINDVTYIQKLIAKII